MDLYIGGFNMMMNKEDSTTSKYCSASQYTRETSNKTQFNDGAGLFWPADAFSRANKKTANQDTSKVR